MELQEGRYQFDGGVDALDIIDQFNAPLYVYEASKMKAQYERMVNAFDVPKLKINYACKALSNINVLKCFQEWGSGLDCVSIQEVWMGLKAGFSPNDILFTPNCVSLDEILLGVEAGVRINVDNIVILEQLGQLRPEVPVCIRLNPHIMAGGNSKISVGHIDSKFGISVHQLPHVLRVVEETGIKVEGLHMHTGSDILDSEVFLTGAQILLKNAKFFPDLDFIDFGSGFKVAYKEGDVSTDIEDLGEQLSVRFRKFCKKYGRNLTLMFEPGKFLVSQAGYFLAAVNVVKTTPSTVFAGIDSGLNHLIRPMFYNAHHEIINISNTAGRTRIYTVVGYICETDTFGINRRLHQVSEGDVLCFLNAGAYCFSMASNYNSRFRPAEVLVKNGKAHLIRRRETLDDLLRTQEMATF